MKHNSALQIDQQFSSKRSKSAEQQLEDSEQSSKSKVSWKVWLFTISYSLTRMLVYFLDQIYNYPYQRSNAYFYSICMVFVILEIISFVINFKKYKASQAKLSASRNEDNLYQLSEESSGKEKNDRKDRIDRNDEMSRQQEWQGQQSVKIDIKQTIVWQALMVVNIVLVGRTIHHDIITFNNNYFLLRLSLLFNSFISLRCVSSMISSPLQFQTITPKIHPKLEPSPNSPNFKSRKSQKFNTYHSILPPNYNHNSTSLTLKKTSLSQLFLICKYFKFQNYYIDYFVLSFLFGTIIDFIVFSGPNSTSTLISIIVLTILYFGIKKIEKSQALGKIKYIFHLE